MAGKGSRKSRKHSKKHAMPKFTVNRFTYDILSHILQRCGFPGTKIPVNEGEKNDYSDPDCLETTSLIILSIAFSFRDNWRLMFESRFRNSGLDSFEKIEKYLALLLNLKDEFTKGNDTAKIHISLALYSEMIQFLNFKGEEVDLQKLFDSWSCFFTKNIAQNQCTYKLLLEIFVNVMGARDFLKDITVFVQEIASPYGKREDVSKEFKKFASAQEAIEMDRKRRITEVATKNILDRLGFLPPNLEDTGVTDAGVVQSALSKVLEMGADLPGDRESPEPPKCSESGGVFEKERSPGKLSTEATGVEESDPSSSSSELEVEDRFRKMSLGDEPVPQNIQGAKPKSKPVRSVKKMGATKCKPATSSSFTTYAEQKVVDSLGSMPPGYEACDVAPLALRSGSDLPGDRDSSDGDNAEESKKPPRKQLAEATGARPKRKPSNKKKRN